MPEPDLHTRLRSAIEERLAETEAEKNWLGRGLLWAWVIRACRADLDRLERHTPQQYEGVRFCPGCPSEDRFHRPCPEVRSLAEVWLEDPPDLSRS